MTSASTTAGAKTARPGVLPIWVIVAISVFFGLFYAYAVWNAIAFLVSQATGPLGLNGAGWAILLAAVVFPLVAFGVAFAIGWRRAWWEFALTLLAGLGLVAVFWLNVVAYSVTNGATLLG
ncbi:MULTISPECIES: bacitracin resistance protein [unclassified Microbacterium]|uniref:bacitracin resistance protein n=1 Tax=unclassified Microbacterium TaxID=2609290 RepID=UPI00301AAE9B